MSGPVVPRTVLRRALATTLGWPAVWAAATGSCVILVVANLWRSELEPLTTWRTAYGVAATVLLLGTLAYSVRRRMPRHGPWTSHAWLRLHIFTGTFFIVLVLMHTGFHLPTSVLGWALWSLALWTAFSGLVGTVIQRWIPRVLSSGLTTEVHYDRIPALVKAIAKRTEETVASCSESVGRYYRDSLAGAMIGPQPRLIYFVDITGGFQARIKDFDYLCRFVGPAEGQRIAELRHLFQTKLEIDAHYTLQRALRWWLYGHVPLVGVLIVLVALHILTVLYY